MESMILYHYNVSSINELYDMLLLQHIEMYSSPCRTNQMVKIYSASCGIWLSCEYQITPQVPVCEKGYNPLPDPSATTVKTWKWQPCGTTCCKRTYTYSRTFDAGSGHYLIRIQQLSKQQLGPCTNDPAPGGDDTYGKPCENGC